MALLKTLWKKTLEVLSYLLIFGLIYKFFIQKKPESIEDIRSDLSNIDDEAAKDLGESEVKFQEEVREAKVEKARIDKLDNSDLASEFDREF